MFFNDEKKFLISKIDLFIKLVTIEDMLEGKEIQEVMLLKNY